MQINHNVKQLIDSSNEYGILKTDLAQRVKVRVTYLPTKLREPMTAAYAKNLLTALNGLLDDRINNLSKIKTEVAQELQQLDDAAASDAASANA